VNLGIGSACNWTKAIGAALATVILAACGGSSGGGSAGDGSAAVNGTISGQTVPTAGTTAISVTQSSDAGLSLTVEGVLISNAVGECGRAQAHTVMPGLTGLLLVVGGFGNSVPTGTYPIGMLTAAGQEAMASYTVDDGHCMTMSSVRATGGTITLTRSDSSDVAGTFDVTFASGDHVTGSFSTPVCPVEYTPDAGPASCG
jgi:hypothetical protein